MFVVMGGRIAFGVLYPAMVADRGWSIAEVTGAFSAGLLIYGPAALAVGVLVDRVGCRATMLVGCASMIAGMALVAVATDLSHLYVAFVLVTGIGSAATGYIAVVKLLALRAGPRFAAAFGLASMGQGLGTLLVSPAIQGTIDLAGWRGGAAAVAVLVVVGLLPLVVLFAPGPRASDRRPATGAGGTPVMSAPFVLFFISNAALGALLLLPTHQVAHLIEAGFAPIAAATAAGAWGALIAAGGPLGGWALERWGYPRLLGVTTVLFGLGTFALVGSAPQAVWLLVPFVLAGGAARGMLGVAHGAAQTRAFAGPRLGRMTGLVDLGYGAGGFLGPWLTALAHDAGGGFAPGILAAIVAATIVSVTVLLGARLSEGERRTT